MQTGFFICITQIMDNSKKASSIKNLSRRQFAKAAAIGIAAAAPLAAISAQTPTPTPPKEPAAPPNPQTSPTPAPPPSPVAVAFGAVAEARFGKLLTPEQLVKVKEDMVGNVRTAERLSAAKLQNADEPDFVFAA
jgi:hypothetical protein